MAGRPLSLLLTVDSLSVGGAERHVVDLARAMRQRGTTVLVAAATGGPLAADLRAAGVPLWVMGERPMKRVADPEYATALRSLMSDRPVDLVHAHLFASAAASAIATAEAAIPLVVTEHSVGAWQGGADRAVARDYLRAADWVVAVSREISRRVEAALPPAGRVVYIPNAVPGALDAPRSRGHSGAPRVGVVARLSQEKGVDLFIDAVQRVAAAIPTASFVVVGDGPSRPALEVRAHAVGLADRIDFLGMLRSAREVIASLDVLVVPSRTDGTPLVVLEAQAAGIAVVAARVGGIPEQIEHGVDGWIVPAEDPDALAVAIHTLLADRPLRDRLGAAGCRRAARWTHAAMVDRAEAVYAAVLDERAVIPPSLRSLDFLSSA